MATWTAAAGGGNWNDNATWEEGGGYPQAGDTANLDAGSGNVNINVTSACAIVNCTGYTGTLTQSADMTTTGNVIFVAGMTFSTSGTPTWTFGTCNFTPAGKTLYNMSVSNSQNCTLVTSDVNVAGSLYLGTGSSYLTSSNRTVTMTGTGTWSHGDTDARLYGTNITFNTAGTITISGTVAVSNGGVITYTAGTINTSGSTLLTGNTTLNTNGMSWNNITLSTNLYTLTVSSNITMVGNLTTSGSIIAWGTNGITFNGDTTINDSMNFYDVTINVGKTLTLTSGKTHYAYGTFTAEGTSGSQITFDTTAAAVAYFYPNTLGTITYVNASYINSDTNWANPTMTSNSAPYGVCSADSVTAGAIWKAFNHVTTASSSGETWGTNSGGGNNHWIQYQFNETMVVTGYTITTSYTGAATNGRKPKNWTFSGSNNGTDWTTLDTQTNQFDNGFAITSASYSFSNTTPYKYYRLTVSANWGDAYLIIAEVRLDGQLPITTTGGSITNTVNWVLTPVETGNAIFMGTAF